MAKKETAISTQGAQAPAAQTAAPAKTNDTDRAGFYIYIGPNLPGLIQSGTIYRGDREAALQAAAEAVEKRPLVKTLIVSGDRLPQARLNVKKPGNALYENYRRLTEKEG